MENNIANHTYDELKDATALGVSNQIIEDMADHFRKLANFDPIKDNIFALAKSLGCNVKVIDATKRDLQEFGTLEVKSPIDWSIFIPSHSSPLDDRFTIAHELGHFILHSIMGTAPIRAYRRFSSNEEPKEVEIEADAFALAFLMPREAVIKTTAVYNDHSDIADIIATEFGVDKSAAALRINWIKSDIK